MLTVIEEIIHHHAFTINLKEQGYEYIGHTQDDDWCYQKGTYTEKAFGRHIVCYDPEQKIYYCKIKRHED